MAPPAAEADEAEDLAAAAASAAVGATANSALPEGAEPATWPDASVEAAFLAEARDRGEVPAPAKAREEIAEETDARPMPALDDLIKRIPPEVRETLEDLFRARFVRVVRVPKKALKR